MNWVQWLSRILLVVSIALLLLFSIQHAFADDISTVTQNMSPEQKAELILQAKKIKDSAGAMSPADLAEYATLGQKYGVALAATAKELGKSVDDIMSTNVGKIATALIIWKVVGDSALSFIVGMLWFVTAMPVWLYMFHRLVIRSREIVEKYNKETGKLESRVYVKTPEDENGATKIIMMFVFFIITAIGMITIF